MCACLQPGLQNSLQTMAVVDLQQAYGMKPPPVPVVI